MEKLTNAEYHAHPAISKSKLDWIARSPAHFHWRYMSGEYVDDGESDALRIGSATHKFVLENDDFWDEYVLVPADAPRKPTTSQLNAKKPSPDSVVAINWWADFSQANADKKMIDAEELAQLTAMRNSVLANKTARFLLSNGEAEQSLFFTDENTGIGCKVRPDWVGNNFIVDLKTTANASRDAFGYSARKYRYHVQAAFYLDGYAQAMPQADLAGFIFIAVEKDPPYATACYLATPEMLSAGQREYQHNLQTLATCMRTGVWPAYGDELMDMKFGRDESY